VVFRNTATFWSTVFANTRSGLLSPFMSAIASVVGLAPAGRSTFIAKLGVVAPVVVWLSKTETVLASVLVTARSGLPSPFTSAMASPDGEAPAGRSTFDAKLGIVAPVVVLLSKTETVLSLKFVTAMSGLPSPLTSPMAAEAGNTPVVRSMLAAKVGGAPL